MTDTQDKTETGWRGSREGWLDAAKSALIENGIGAVKIQPLAERIGLSRTSFYWFFKDRAAVLDALLEDWKATNTGVLVSACDAYAETVQEAVLNLIAEFLDDGGFDARLDFAIRGWAHQSDAVRAQVAEADETRLAAIRALFAQFGFDEAEADVRARTIYLVQIGYISMQVQEDLDTRLARFPHYVQTYTGQPPSAREMARVTARFR